MIVRTLDGWPMVVGEAVGAIIGTFRGKGEVVGVKVEEMLNALNDESQVTKRLTAWETEFVESLTDQFERGQGVSERQREILERIYAEKTA